MLRNTQVWRWAFLAAISFLPACAGSQFTGLSSALGGSGRLEVRPDFETSLVGERPSLFQKAVELEALIQKRHLTQDGLLAYGIGLASPESEEVIGMAFSDMAIWSGCYVAAQAFRYAVTGDPAAEKQVRTSVQGLHLLQEVTGKRGLLARGIKGWDDENPEKGSNWHRGVGPFSRYQWLGDVSVDQIDGVLFGYAVAYDLIGDQALRQSIANHVGAISDHIIGHGMIIQDVDGGPTKHGDLKAGFFSEPLNSLIALAVVKAAYHMTRDERYQQHYLELVRLKNYHKRAVRARDPWWEVFTGVNHSDNNLSFLAYYTLLRYEDDPVLSGYYLKSLDRTWNVVREEGNPLFTFIYQSLSPAGNRDAQAIAKAIETLRLFPVDRRNHRVMNSTRPEVCKSLWRDRFDRRQSCRPVPMDLRPADVFEWKENPYRLDGGGEGNLEFSGVDYLLPYSIGRYHGFI